MKSTMKKLLIGAAVVSTLLGAIAFAGGHDLFNDDSKLVGNWTGESLCVGNHPACHDEQVNYRISKPSDEAGTVTIGADKIVDGKPQTMGVLGFKYDREKGTLINEFTNSRYHGVWELTVKGNVMEGTLTLLPEKTIARRVKVKKDQ